MEDILITLAQIIATLAGLFSIFVFQRITQVRDIIIGDGKAHLRREDDATVKEKYNEFNENYYEGEQENKLDQNRWKDAIDRKNLQGIREAIYKTDYRELKAHLLLQNGKLKDNWHDLSAKDDKNKFVKATGYFHNARPRFDDTLEQLENLQYWLYGTIVLFFVSIFFIFFYLIQGSFCFCSPTPFVILGLLFITLLLLLIVISKSLFGEMPHEKEKRNECKRMDRLIKKEIPNGLKRAHTYKT